MATVGKRRKRRVSGTTAVGRTRRRRRVSGTTAVGRTRRRRRVGSTSAVGRTSHRRRRRVGATSAGGLMKQVIPMAVGMAAGVGIQHFVLRPIEAKLAQRVPMAAKFMALGEIVLGGFIALKAKNPIMKGVGLGIMAGGVQTGVKQLNIYHESPSVQGVGDYTTVRVPINGNIRNLLNGIVRHGHHGHHHHMHDYTRTSLVAGDEYMGDSSWAENQRIDRTNLLAGIYGLDGVGNHSGELEQDNYLEPKGYNY